MLDQNGPGTWFLCTVANDQAGRNAGYTSVGGRFVVGALAPEERAEVRTTNGSRGDLDHLGPVVVLEAVVRRVAIPRAPSPSSHICQVQAWPEVQISWRKRMIEITR